MSDPRALQVDVVVKTTPKHCGIPQDRQLHCNCGKGDNTNQPGRVSVELLVHRAGRLGYTFDRIPFLGGNGSNNYRENSSRVFVARTFDSLLLSVCTYVHFVKAAILSVFDVLVIYMKP